MDRSEPDRRSHISATNKIAGIEVNVYLTPDDWQRLVDSGSVTVTQPYESAAQDARIVRIAIHQR
jgi:surface antigen